MARISDTIENFIKDLLVNESSREIVIQRNDIASKFNCAPSQINYVLSTRFTYEKGYIIESKRGGGGCIVIKHITFNKITTRLEHLINSIDTSITYSAAEALIKHLYETNIISNNEYNIIKVSINDRTLKSVEDKNKVRADILRGVITVILS